MAKTRAGSGGEKSFYPSFRLGTWSLVCRQVKLFDNGGWLAILGGRKQGNVNLEESVRSTLWLKKRSTTA